MCACVCGGGKKKRRREMKSKWRQMGGDNYHPFPGLARAHKAWDVHPDMPLFFWPPLLWIMTRNLCPSLQVSVSTSGLESNRHTITASVYIHYKLPCGCYLQNSSIFYQLIHWGRRIMKKTHGILTNFFLLCLPVLKVPSFTSTFFF